MTKDAAGEGPVDIAVRPCAWRWPVMKLRGVDWRYTKHLPQHENCEPLYGLPALDAAVAAERERCATACREWQAGRLPHGTGTHDLLRAIEGPCN